MDQILRESREEEPTNTTEVRVVGGEDQIELIARTHGAVPRIRRRRDGSTAGYFEVTPPKVVCLDCETTGLDPVEDEILTLSIVDWSGNVLLDGKYKPGRKAEWPEAERVNGISPRSVEGCPSIHEDAPKIREILAMADEVVAYNAEFDLSFLAAAGLFKFDRDGQKITDTMLDFAYAAGEWDDYHEGWKWHKLTVAARRIGYEWTGRAHGSLADAPACLAVQKWVERKLRG